MGSIQKAIVLPHYRRGVPLSNIENQRRLEIYRLGLTDQECAAQLSLTARGFKSWRVNQRLLRVPQGYRCPKHGHLLRVSPRHRRKDKAYTNPERSPYMTNHGYCVQCGETVEIHRLKQC